MSWQRSGRVLICHTGDGCLIQGKLKNSYTLHHVHCISDAFSAETLLYVHVQHLFFEEHEPKDHLAENVRRMRHIQRESRKKQGGVNEPVKGLWKSTKYEGVTSKVKNELIKVRWTCIKGVMCLLFL